MPSRKWTAPAARRFAHDPLLSNSFFLALNAGTQAAVSFVFWLLNSHLYSAGQIGTATTLLSGAVTISWISLFGFNSTFIRFLPDSRQPNEEINTGLLMVFATGLVAALLYVAIVPLVVPRLGLVRASFSFAAGFIVLTAFMGVNLVTDSVFIAFRKVPYNVLVDGAIQGAVKLALPVLLVGLGAYGVFMSWGLAALVAVAASIVFMTQIVGYRPRLRVSPGVLRRTWNYSAANYGANLLALCPPLAIPLIVLDMRGPRQAAFYFVAYQVANLLFALGWAVSTSFFAEGSHEGSDLASLLRRSAKVIALVCIPCGIFVAATGHWILLMFGLAYSVGGTSTLAILALSTPLVALSSTAMMVLRITKQLRALVLATAVYAAVIVGLALLGARRGLPWVAAAYVVGTTAAGLLAAGLAAARWRAERAARDVHPVPR
jgi:O-antigen/teichoic acid export membrane protein